MANLKRNAIWDKIERQNWDVVVVGGGISGAGIAQQAARQGWSVLLLEQKDFAWGTSSRSSKLVHGGLRYLKQGDFKTTFHSVRERQRLMQEAPELIEPQPFLFPLCKGRKPGRWMFQLGLMVYDWMAGSRSHFVADLQTVRELAPGLDPQGMHSAMVFTDAKTDDSRLVWRVLSEAIQDGATVLNYAHVTKTALTFDTKSLHVVDARCGAAYQVRCKAIINATGVWGDRLRIKKDTKPLLRPLRGSHLIVPLTRLPVTHSISFMHRQDGRPVFLYPWEGATLIGTTDLDYQGNLQDEPSITPQETQYLLDAVNEQFPHARITRKDVVACYAGVRPVVEDGSSQASDAAREHVVLDEEGVITLAGGKLTTFRLMAQDALSLAALHTGKPFERNAQRLFTPTPTLPSHWSSSVQSRLTARYGARVLQLTEDFDLSTDSSVATELLDTIPGTQTLWLELIIACRHEAVEHLDDLMLRRTRIGILLPEGGLAHVARIRALCQPHLNWDEYTWDEEIERYRSIVQRHYQLPTVP
jgi:glycerol-3-phosphate dehydrogenase